MNARWSIALAAVLFVVIRAPAAEPIPRGLVEAIFPNSSVSATGDGLLVRAAPKSLWSAKRYVSDVLFRNTDGHTTIRASPRGSPGTWKVQYSDGRTAEVRVRDREAVWTPPDNAANRRRARFVDGKWRSPPLAKP